MLLTLKYRPKSFQDIVGQPQVQAILRKQVELDRLQPLMLLSGKSGTGKTTTGRVLAAALNCPNSKDACGQCRTCVDIQESNSLLAWELDAASHGGVADIRALKPKLDTAFFGKRVVIFDEAQSLSRDAQNALLAIFEDPPQDVYFLLLTTEPTALIKPIRDRAEPYDFFKISTKVVIDRLQFIAREEQIEVDQDLLMFIVNKGQGSLRNSIKFLDQVSSVGITTLAQYSELLLVSDFSPSLIAHMSVGDVARVGEIVDAELSMHGDYRYFIDELTSTLRDTLVLKNGGSIEALGKRLAMRQTLAGHVDGSLVVAALHLLWDLKTKLRDSDPKTSIQLATVLMTETLSKGVKREKKVDDPNHVMSAEELRNFS